MGRKNGRTKKAKGISVSSGDEPPDEDTHGKPWTTIFGDWSSEEPEKAAKQIKSDEEPSDLSVGEQEKRQK